MRKTFYGSCAASLCLFLLTIANTYSMEKQDALVLLRKSIGALGGEKISHLKAHWKGELIGYGKSTAIGAMTEVFFEFPDKIRLILSDKSTRLAIIVCNGKKSWTKTGEGESIESNIEDAKFIQPDILLELLIQKNEKIKATRLQIIRNNDKPTICVEVTHPGYKSAYYYFDSETFLPVKYEEGMNKQERTGATLSFLDYKTVAGVKYPSRIESFIAGNRRGTYIIKELEILKDIDEKLFKRP